jgi:hypothetical protein
VSKSGTGRGGQEKKKRMKRNEIHLCRNKTQENKLKQHRIRGKEQGSAVEEGYSDLSTMHKHIPYQGKIPLNKEQTHKHKSKNEKQVTLRGGG